VQEYPGNATYRKFSMNEFGTAYPYIPEPIGPSVCEGFFIRILPSAPGHCGLISIDLKGYLYLPFFYIDSQFDYGTWLPVSVEIQVAFPVFVTD